MNKNQTLLMIRGLCHEIDMNSYYCEEELDHTEKEGALLDKLIDLFTESLAGEKLNKEERQEIYNWLYSTQD